MTTIHTNMDWKATPNYSAANGTAGDADPETGIVKFEDGKIAKTDEVEIIFSDFLLDKNSANYKKAQSHIVSLKDNSLLQTKVDPNDPTVLHSSDIWGGRFQNTVVATDGSTFTVDYVYDRNAGKDYRSDYLSGMKDMATNNLAAKTNGAYERKDTYVIGGESHADVCRTFNIKADIIANFSTASSFIDDRQAIDKAFFASLKEIEQNMANGKENPTSGLKTTVTVNGTEWNFAELLNTVEEINKSFEYFNTHVTMDYSDYAQLGVSKAHVTDWARKNLSEDKQNVIANALNTRVETYILREKESLEKHKDIWDKPGVVISGDKAKYYDSSVLSASNKEVRDTIMKLFEETDYDSSASVSKAINNYKDIMLPILEAFCGRKSAAPDYVNDAVNSIYKYIADIFGGKAAHGLNVSV